jgi:hypothetical protein
METFVATHKLHEAGQPIVVTDAAVPEELKALLNQVGTSTYANGFFRFVTPESMRQYLALFNLNQAECYPFLKCAFGHLLFYQDGEYKVLDPVFNSVDSLGGKEDFDFVLNIALCDRDALESTFMIDIYEQAFPTHGVAALDEIYAFVPALGLGGSRNAENVRKSNMLVEMNILSQL